jgi:regulator of protease activity HflC (stomatin/prohibitin superfamily)
MEDFGWFGVLVIGIIVIVACGFIVLVNPFVSVGAGHSVVLTYWGKVEQNTLSSGLHTTNPIGRGVTDMDLRIQKHEIEANAATKDMQDVKIKVAVAYQLQVDNVQKLFEKIGDDDMIKDVVLAPAVQEAVKEVSAKFTAEELLTKRAEFKEASDKAIKNRVAEYYFNIEEISVIDFNFSEDFNKAIEAKQVAEQRAKQAMYEVDQAKAEAEKYKNQSSQLSDMLLRKMWIEKWNGQLPQVVSDKEILYGLQK